MSIARWGGTLSIIIALGVLSMAMAVSENDSAERSLPNDALLQNSGILNLPSPHTDGGISLAKALLVRRSVRSIRSDSLTLENVSQLLWSAQGVTDDMGHRTAGSAFESYPLEVYVLVGNVTNLNAGVYRYLPGNHSLDQLSRSDPRQGFVNASVVTANGWIKEAPVIFLITAVFDRAAKKGADNSTVYVEVGLASENLLLEVVSQGLGCTYVAGFDPAKAAQFLNLSKGELPIALLPVGKKA
jgi:SagB-type dehydrogenase family enzyme